MGSWLVSDKGAVVISSLGLLAFVAYAFLVSRYLLEKLTPGRTAALIETLVVIAIVAAWIYGLLSASGESRAGWIVLLITSLLPALFTLYDLLFYSPIPYGWPLLQIVVWTAFSLNAIACAAVINQLRS